MSDFKSPTAVLVAISQKTNLPELKRWLVTTDVYDALYFEEAWTALWRLTETTETTAKEFAYYAKLAAVNALVEARPPTYPAEFPARLAALVCGFAQRTSFATFGDEYVAAALKMKLPAAETVWHPRKIPAYAVAAAVLGEATNSVVRPLIEQPIKEIILGTKWRSTHTQSLFACVVACKEMVRFPELYIDSDIASCSNSAEPAIAITQCAEGPKINVVREGKLIPAKSIADALLICFVSAREHGGAQSVLSVLREEDTGSALAHAYRTGLKL